jgi:hypothetical protein
MPRGVPARTRPGAGLSTVRRRHVTTGITLLVLVCILAAGAWVGTQYLFAPLPGEQSAEPSPGCATKALRRGQRISTRQVVVSVYNAGTRAGLADTTMRVLTNRGFARGSVGNAPAGSGVKVAQIWTTRRKDAAAHLVALQFGPAIKVKIKKVDLGPGVDVVVGNGFRKLAAAKRTLVVKRRQTVCLPSRRPRG